MATEAGTAPISDETALVDFLRDRDVQCPLCRYNLRGLSSSRCPECGRELRLGVWLAEPRQATWVVGLVSLVLAGGIGLLLLTMVVMHGMPAGDSTVLRMALAYFIAALPLSAAWIWFRRRFLRLALNTQWLLAGAAVISFTVALLTFLTEIDN